MMDNTKDTMTLISVNGFNNECDTYLETKDSFSRMLEKGTPVSTTMVKNVIELIKSDLSADDDHVRKDALNMIEFLLENKICGPYLPIDIFQVIENCVCETELKVLFEHHLANDIFLAFSNDTLNLSEIFISTDPQFIQCVLGGMLKFFISLDIDSQKKVLVSIIVPELFDIKTDNSIRHHLIEFAFSLISVCSISNFTTHEIKKFNANVVERHVKGLETLRDQNYPNWHKLWIFLIRFSGKVFHSSMDLANRLLRVVEHSFRFPSHEQRLRSYECWKEIIDNASLDMTRMCTTKQIKLLVTPLKAKFSRMEVVLCKRFDTFVYLLKKLQGRSYLCLPEFLDFCFGPFGQPINNKNAQGRLVPALWLKSITVFLEILGYNNVKSLTSLEVGGFTEPVITKNNIGPFIEIIVNSTIESGSLLKETTIPEDKKAQIISAIWDRLLEIVLSADDSIRSSCFKTVLPILKTHIKSLKTELILSRLLHLMTKLYEETEFCYIEEQILEKIITYLEDVEPTSEILENISQIVEKYIKTYSAYKVLELLLKSNTEKNFEIFKNLWLECRHSINLTIEYISVNLLFLLWPAFHMDMYDTSSSADIRQIWLSVYLDIAEDNSSKMLLLEKIEDALKKNSSLVNNVASILILMGSVEKTWSKSIAMATTKLTSNVLSTPNLSKSHIKHLEESIFTNCISNINFFKENDFEEFVLHVCKCVSHAVQTLEELSFARSFRKFRDIISQQSEMDVNVTNNILNTMKVIEQKENKMIKTPESSKSGAQPKSLSSRSLKITQMVVESPSTKNYDKVNALRLFGKDVETSTPLNVKGSLLHNKSMKSPYNNRSKKILDSIQKQPEKVDLNDEQTCDFAVIDSEVKIDSNKLNQHQIEVMKKRREDIPALYQDLSQSQSQDLFKMLSTSSTSKDKDENIVKDKDENIVKDKDENIVKDKDENIVKDTEKVVENPIEFIEYQDNATKPDLPGALPDIIKKRLEVFDFTSDDSNSSTGSGSRRSISKIERELQRIQMNIVGVNEFVNLPTIRTRKSFEPEKKSRARKKRTTALTPPVEDVQIKTNDTEVVQNTDKIEKVEEEAADILEENGKEPQKEVLNETENAVEVVDVSLPAHLDTPENEKTESVEVDEPKPDRDVAETEDRPNENRTDKIDSEFVIDDKSDNDTKINLDSTVDSTEQTAVKPRKAKSILDIKKKVIKKKNQIKVKLKPKQFKNAVSNQAKISDLLTLAKPVPQEPPKNVTETTISEEPLTENEIVVKELEVIPQNKPLVQNRNVGNISSVKRVLSETRRKKKRPEKIVFIREIANSNQQTKLSAGSLKINKDKVSRNIAYSIEAPKHSDTMITSIDLNLVKDLNLPNIQLHPNISETILQMNTDTEKLGEQTKQEIKIEPKTIKGVKKRKRRNREKVINNTEISEEPIKAEISLEKDDKECIKMETEENNKSLSSSESLSTCENSDVSPMQQRRKPGRPKKSKNGRRGRPKVLTANSSNFSNSSVSDSTLPSIGTNEDLSQKSQNNEIDIMPLDQSINNAALSQSDEIIESSQEASKEKSCISLGSPPKKRGRPSHGSPKRAKLAPKQGCRRSPRKSANLNSDSAEADTQTQPGSNNLNDSNEPVPTLMFNSTMDVLKDIIGITKSDDSSVGQEDQDPIEIPETINQDQDVDICCSPVTEDTPKKTKQLLDNTLDISPIKSENNDNKNYDINPNLNEKESTSENEEAPNKSAGSTPWKIGARSSRLLNLMNIESPAVQKQHSTPLAVALPTALTPTTGRTRRIISSLASERNDVGKVNEFKNDEENFLTFSREVPSPLVNPSSSILKRKISDVDNIIAPNAKRKRVNFSDPCTTSKKVYVRHKEEYSMYRPLDPLALFRNDEDENESDDNDRELETEESMDVMNPMLYDDTSPIFKELVDCQESLSPLWKKLSSPMYCALLKKKLADRNVQTIGELAGLTEREVSRLPFKKPPIKIVTKALEHFYKNDYSRRDLQNEQTSNGSEGHFDEVLANDLFFEQVPDTVEVNKVLLPYICDLQDQMKDFAEKLKGQDLSLEESTTLFVNTVDQSTLTNILENVYNLNVQAVLKKYIKDIQPSDVHDFAKTILEYLEGNAEHFRQYFKESSQTKEKDISASAPVPSLEDVKTVLETTAQAFSKEALLENCIIPFLGSPKDLSPYLNSLTLTQINELMMDRIQAQDLKALIAQMVESYGNYTVAECVDKNDVLRLCSPEDLCNAIVDKNSQLGSIKQLISTVTDEDELVEIQKMINGKLSPKAGLNAYKEFIESITKLFDK